MKIRIISVGKGHDKSIEEGILDFTGRLAHYTNLEWKLIPNGHDEKDEAYAILKAVGEKDYAILLDEKGKEISTLQLAEVLERHIVEATQKITFIIGGAHGVTDEVRKRANYIWSLSKLTFPHQLVRLILAEQLYRAFTILRGEKYHHQ